VNGIGFLHGHIVQYFVYSIVITSTNILLSSPKWEDGNPTYYLSTIVGSESIIEEKVGN
jgi:hypothetical protein